MKKRIEITRASLLKKQAELSCSNESINPESYIYIRPECFDLVEHVNLSALHIRAPLLSYSNCPTDLLFKYADKILEDIKESELEGDHMTMKNFISPILLNKNLSAHYLNSFANIWKEVMMKSYANTTVDSSDLTLRFAIQFGLLHNSSIPSSVLSMMEETYFHKVDTKSSEYKDFKRSVMLYGDKGLKTTLLAREILEV